MEYCIKCDVQMVHKENVDICPNCGFEHDIRPMCPYCGSHDVTQDPDGGYECLNDQCPGPSDDPETDTTVHYD